MKCKGFKRKDNTDIYCIIETYGSSEYCLFHNPNKTATEANLFWEVINYNRYNETVDDLLNGRISTPSPELTRIISTKMRFDHLSNMQGYIFPKINGGIKFNAQYPIQYPNNQKYNFDDAIFECDIYFDDYIFNSVATFRNTIFKNEASFHNTIFREAVIFENPHFQYASTHSIFRFKRAQFLGHTFEYKSYEFGENFTGIEFGDTTIFNLDIKDRGNGSCKNAFRIAKMQAYKIHDNLNASEYYYKERFYRYNHLQCWDNLKDTFTIIGDDFNRWSIGYGEKPWRLFRPATILIFLFPIFYLFTGFNSSSINSLNGESSSTILNYKFSLSNIGQNFNLDFLSEFFKDYFEALFFSICTFFAQTYGSAPINGLGQFFVSIQMFFGVLFFSLFTAIYLNKLLK